MGCISLVRDKKTVWITRTYPGAYETAKRIKALGFNPLIAPLLEISAPDIVPPRPDKGTVLIFTSKNGIDAFCQNFKDRDFKVVTVGTQSAIHAREQGFTSVKSAYGTAGSVTEIILKTVQTQTPILHCAGRHVRGTIVGDLQDAGYTARRDLYYCSKPVEALPDVDIADVSHILLFSPLAAKTLADLKPDLAHCHLISISQNTDDALGMMKALSCKIAKTPTEKAVLSCLSA